jgi:hypothetical protein
MEVQRLYVVTLRLKFSCTLDKLTAFYSIGTFQSIAHRQLLSVRECQWSRFRASPNLASFNAACEITPSQTPRLRCIIEHRTSLFPALGNNVEHADETMSFDSSLLNSSFSTHSPTTSFGSTSYEVRRSRSRRRCSSASEDDRGIAKFARTDVLPYRKRRAQKAPRRLCGGCYGLDLNQIVTSGKQVTSALGEFVAYLDWATDSSCTLCAFFQSMRVLHPHSSEDKAQEIGYHLRAFSGMLSYREYFLRPPNNKKISNSSDTMLAVVPNGLFSDLKSPGQHYTDTFGSVGYILPVAYSSFSPWLTGRLVEPLRINIPLIQDWLQHCKKKHSCTMRYSRPSSLLMIDCKTLEIVTPPPNCNYFALSYVWGSSPASSQDPAPNTRDLLRAAAPVVRDAIKVVQSLGWRYLWVDKYCIPQADPMLKGEQIGKMDLIYEGAYCTIVAASGSNDQTGLPGVSIARHTQPFYKLDGRDVQLVSSLPDPQATIKASTWMTRAWTFQEAYCSARRLVFTPYQVYFECKAMHSSEAVELPLPLLSGSHARPVLFGDEWLAGTHRFGALSAFWAAVKAYSLRCMTFDADALAALEGILRRFQASPAFVYNIFGIPVVLEGGARGNKDTLLDARLFVAGLSWHHAGAARRRKQFPSWAWAGWEGGVQLQRTFGAVGYVSYMQLWVEDTDGVTYPWDMFWDGFWRPEARARCYARFRCVIIEADVFKVQLVPRVYQQEQIMWATGKSTVFDMLSPYDPTIKYSSVMLPTGLLNDTKIATELWDCLILGAKANGTNPDIMLLRWDVDIAERIWAGTLWPQKSYGGESGVSFPPSMRRRFKLG